MLKYIEEDKKYVEITGFRNIKIEDAENFLKAVRKEKPPNTTIQFFDAELVATWQHLYFAVLNALTAFRNKAIISKSLEMEILLYASSQRQIQKAIPLTGVKRASANIATVIVNEKPENVKAALSSISKRINAEPDETVLKLSKEKIANIRRAFNISDEEIEAVIEKNNTEQAVVDLVTERMALLSTQL